jgi:hypothetical protein
MATGSIRKSNPTIKREAMIGVKMLCLTIFNEILCDTRINTTQFTPIIKGISKILKPKFDPYL